MHHWYNTVSKVDRRITLAAKVAVRWGGEGSRLSPWDPAGSAHVMPAERTRSCDNVTGTVSLFRSHRSVAPHQPRRLPGERSRSHLRYPIATVKAWTQRWCYAYPIAMVKPWTPSRCHELYMPQNYMPQNDPLGQPRYAQQPKATSRLVLSARM